MSYFRVERQVIQYSTYIIQADSAEQAKQIVDAEDFDVFNEAKDDWEGEPYYTVDPM